MTQRRYVCADVLHKVTVTQARLLHHVIHSLIQSGAHILSLSHL